MRNQVLLAGLLPLATSVLVAWQAGQLPLRGQKIAPDAGPRACASPLKFKVAFQTYKGPVPGLSSISESVQSNIFMENGWLTADTCQAGTLRVLGDGQVAGGAAPQLQVALNSEVIWTGTFTEQREVSIPIPAAGHLTLGYFNDFYSSDYRGVTFDQMRFDSPSCQGFDVQVPSDAGGWWNPETRSGGWIFKPPVTVKLCGTGQLQLKVTGRKGGGAFAFLAFKQGGRNIQQVQLSERPQDLRLNLTGEPLKIQILNPYYKELGDRNLSLQEIEFRPAR